MFSLSVRRSAVLAAVATGVLVLSAGTAAAHVTVNPGEEEQGGYAKLAFRVPNESDTASTVKLRVSFPRDTPLASVRVKPHQGWKADVTESTLPTPVEVGDLTLEKAVTSVTWTAEKGVRIAPGEFDEFEVSAGPLPEKASLAFPTVQTYDDGEAVAWDQPTKEGAEEPEHPAPALTLTPSTGSGHGAAAPAGDNSGDDAGKAEDGGTTPEASEASTVDPTARALAAAGLGVAALCLVAAVMSLVAVRRRTAG